MKKYFKGWYFKNTSKNYSIALIPGIAISGKNKKAFIQVVTDFKSFYVSFPYEDFQYSKNPFYVKIGNSFFSKERIFLNIDVPKLKLTGELFFQNITKIKTNLYAPTIMGPFSYIPKMQCKHNILSLHHYVNGDLKLNQKKISFNKGSGYIEKDSGSSFPKKYLWLQGNNFKKDIVSVMIAVANIPFGLCSFTGLISVLFINGCEYRFTTYNNGKIKELKDQKDKYYIKLQNPKYIMECTVFAKGGKPLKAPIKGMMNHTIKETLNCIINLKLKNKSGKLLYKGTSKGGFEWQL